MISLSTTTQNADGNVIFYKTSKSRLGVKEARVTRTVTLDGGVFITNLGYSDGDRTIMFDATINKTQAEKITDIFELYKEVLLSMEDGIYLATISRLDIKGTKIKMTIYIEQKEN